ncbi:unnamed protein product [Caretta caretta]
MFQYSEPITIGIKIFVHSTDDMLMASSNSLWMSRGPQVISSKNEDLIIFAGLPETFFKHLQDGTRTPEPEFSLQPRALSTPIIPVLRELL